MMLPLVSDCVLLDQQQRRDALFLAQLLEEGLEHLQPAVVHVVDDREVEHQAPRLGVVVLFQKAPDVLLEELLERRRVGEEGRRVSVDHEHVAAVLRVARVHLDAAVHGRLAVGVHHAVQPIEPEQERGAADDEPAPAMMP